jgi:hypothetical protein
MKSVWVFNGVQSSFPSGVFSSEELAEAWISKNGLTGTLTEYPVDVGMHDYATSRGHFEPSKPEHKTALFIGKFSGGGIGHDHYEDGKKG